ncbi:MAG: hypothetical protein HYR66_09500 [Sphingobacteriales bacterium]|nr:hypothetical protein [Sphingobacteriales bacterium]MBI3719853.1 hypothetical protein [Sphingobacteriales bacterium]
MKYCYALLLVLALGIACKPKPLTGKELEDKLKTTMTDYLHKSMKPGTEVEIKDMTYYPDNIKNVYLCEFNVRVKYQQSDTTGKMSAAISTDFKTVNRTR